MYLRKSKQKQVKLKDNGSCVNKKTSQNTIPLILLLFITLQKLSSTHREVASLLNYSARNHIWNANTPIIIAFCEYVVRIIGPRIDLDLCVICLLDAKTDSGSKTWFNI